MARLVYSVSMSLDGFAAGPDQSEAHPLGVGGERLHDWMRALAAWREAAGLDGGVDNESTEVLKADEDNIGAIIMGRNMFGGGPGPWGTPPWPGWWGPNPPFHLPVFVLTNHPRERLACEGGTTFEFVTGGIESALELASAAAGGKDVAISGGASTARQYLAAGRIDELQIHLVPALLGRGVRLFDGPDLGELTMEQDSAVVAPGVTHLTYRLLR